MQDPFLGQYLEYEHLYPVKPPSIEQSSEFFYQFRASDLVESIAKTNIAIWKTQGDWVKQIEIQNFLLGLYFNNQEQKQLAIIANKNLSRKIPTVIFHRQQLLMALKLVLLNPNHTGKALIGEIDYRQELGKHLLAISTNLSTSGDDPYESLFSTIMFEKIRQEIARLYYFSHQGSFRQNFPRATYQWLDLPKEKSFKRVLVLDKVNTDFEQEFFDETGMSIEDFILISFVYIANLYGLDVKTKNPRDFVIMHSFWSQTAIANTGEKIIKQFLHQKIDDFKKTYSESVKKDLKGKDFFMTNFMPFVKKPIIDVKESFSIVADPHYLEDAISAGPYWILLNRFQRLGQQNTKGRELSKYFGLLHQEYIYRLLTEICDSVIRINERQNTPTCDFVGVIEDEKECFLFFIETKKIHFSLPLVLLSDKEATKANLEKIMGKDGFGQVFSTIKLFEDHQLSELNSLSQKPIKTIFPIVATSTFIVEEPLNRKFYEDNFLKDLRQEYSLQGAVPIAHPMFFSSEELEVIEATKIKNVKSPFLALLMHRNHELSIRNLVYKQTQFIPNMEIVDIGEIVKKLLPVWQMIALLKYTKKKNKRLRKTYDKWTEVTKQKLFPNNVVGSSQVQG